MVLQTGSVDSLSQPVKGGHMTVNSDVHVDVSLMSDIDMKTSERWRMISYSSIGYLRCLIILTVNSFTACCDVSK